MSSYFLYADPESLEVLAAPSEKVILIGGDFGYGNFGDIQQHVNSIRVVKKGGRFRTVSVFATDVISSAGFPAWAKKKYNTDAILFVSACPHKVVGDDPGIAPVRLVSGVSGLLLYGGGFLNAMWGKFVLGFVQYMLDRLPDIAYWVSGQQITEPFDLQVVEHVKTHKPALFGVRDHHSLRLLKDRGYSATYSFDDATESLLELGSQCLQKSESGLVLHLNLSDYTENLTDTDEIIKELNTMARCDAASQVTVFQAFRDCRDNVVDSRESITRLENTFPLIDYRTVELASMSYADALPLRRPVAASIGYSCSYHVTLWLQLCGIPCFMRRSNAYYDQKYRALGLTQGFAQFIESPMLVNHAENLERRATWREWLSRTVDTAPGIRRHFEIDTSAYSQGAGPFRFKGKTNLNEQIQFLTARLQRSEEDYRSAAVLTADLQSRLADMQNTVLQKAAQCHSADMRAAELQTHLTSIQNTVSWKITQPLRKIRHLIATKSTPSKGTQPDEI